MIMRKQIQKGALQKKKKKMWDKKDRVTEGHQRHVNFMGSVKLERMWGEKKTF